MYKQLREENISRTPLSSSCGNQNFGQHMPIKENRGKEQQMFLSALLRQKPEAKLSASGRQSCSKTAWELSSGFQTEVSRASSENSNSWQKDMETKA